MSITENRILRLSETNSTNSLLREMATHGAENGQVIITRRQSGGRGRQGRSFASPEGGLYLSYLYRPEDPIVSPGSLTAAAAVAVCRAVERICGISPGIKWVNDLVLEGKKLCGILCEALSTDSGPAYVIGVGLNVNTPEEDFSPELQGAAGSIYGRTGQRFDIGQLGLAVVRELDEIPGTDCLEEYRARCVSLGRDVLVVQGGRSFAAFAEAIDEDFALVVRHPDGRRESLSFGEVSTRI